MGRRTGIRLLLLSCLVAAGLAAASPGARAEEEPAPADILPAIVSAKDMPPGFAGPGPLRTEKAPPGASLSFRKDTPAYADPEVRVTLKRWKNAKAPEFMYRYLRDEKFVVSPDLRLGDSSLLTAEVFDERAPEGSRYVSQTATVFWDLWQLSAEIVHYENRRAAAPGGPVVFSDRAAERFLRALVPVLFDRFLKVVQAGAADAFTADAAEIEREGEEETRHTPEWCREQRRKLADSDPERFQQGIVGYVIAATGEQEIDLCTGGVRKNRPGMPVRIGDCIRTGSDGRARLILNDRDEARHAGPSTIGIGANSEMCVGRFETRFAGSGARKAVMDVLKGAVRTILRGWGPDSSFTVRAGVALCGIRGSEVLVTHDPAAGTATAYVFEGHAEMRNVRTGEVRALAAGQKVALADGRLGPVRPLGGGEWIRTVRAAGVDLDAPEAGIDRPGLDFRSFVADDTGTCRRACLDDGRCRAFTWVRPGLQGPRGRCWLKSAVPAPRPADCCVSGVVDR